MGRFPIGIGAILLAASTAAPAGAAEGISVLRNPGPRHVAGRVFAKYVVDGAKRHMCTPQTSLAEADRTSAPPGGCAQGYVCGGVEIPPAANGACASYTIATAGWLAEEASRERGWAFETLSGGGGRPMTLRFVNHAFGLPDPCVIREVGLVFNRPGGRAASAFRAHEDGRPYRFGDFSKVVVSFDAAVDTGGFRPASCPTMPTAYVTVDFRVGWGRLSEDPDDGTKPQGRLLGLILFGNDGVTASGRAARDGVFWRGGDGRKAILHGDELGPGLPRIPRLGATMRHYEIDLKAIWKAKVTPPPGFTLDDAYLNGLDIYSSVRGGNLDLTLANVDLVGVP